MVRKTKMYIFKLERKPFADSFNSKGQLLPRFVIRKGKGTSASKAYSKASPFFKKNYKIKDYLF